MSFSHFLKFVRNFIRTGQLGRINGFGRCIQVVDRCSAQRRLSEKSFVLNLFIRTSNLLGGYYQIKDNF